MAEILPPILWKQGLKGWLAFFLSLPFFLVFFTLVNAMWMPLGFVVVLLNVLCCRGATLGQFMNVAVLAIDVAMGWLFTQNPFCPHGVAANVGKWLYVVLLPILYFVGRCFDGCRKRKAKAQGIEEAVPAADEDFKEVQVSPNVSVLSARFSEGLESACAMTVIRGDDWVMFFNPIFTPLSVYRKFGEGKKRVIMFLPTLGHHMAADLCMAAHPNAEIYGSSGAGNRHVPTLSVKSPSELELPGFQHFDVSLTLYDEHWLFYEPEGLLLLGDFMPHIDDSADLPACLSSCMLRASHCFYKTTMLNYSICLVTRPDVVEAAVSKILKLNIKHLQGAHDTDPLQTGARKHEDPRQALFNYWRWLLPQNLVNELAVELV